MTDVQKLFKQAVSAFRAEQYKEAEHQCRHLLRFDAKHPDVLHILALSLQHQYQPKAAAENLKVALKHHPEHTPSRKTLINLYIKHGFFNLAEEHIHELQRQLPNQFEPYLLHAQLFRSMGLPEQALQAIAKAKQQLSQPSPLVDYLLACIDYDLERYQDTEAVLLNLVKQLPEYIDAHVALNKLYWEHGPQEKFLTSIDAALQRLPQSRALKYSLAAHQLMAGRYDNCIQTCTDVLSKFPDWAEFHHLKGSALSRFDRIDEALESFDKALQLQPNVIRHRIDIATTLMRKGQFESALEHLKAAEKLHPHSQEVIAYKALCLHALENPQAERLNDYSNFVKIIPLQAPSDYASTEHFMSELAETLQELHKTHQQPLDQSVRHGTQTVGNLFAQNQPILQTFKQMIATAAESYVAQLPNDPKHPLLSRKTDGVRFTGAWSVRLTENGFHSNHVHPEGWISCCTYIQLPKQVKEDDPTHAGWIKFGESGLELPGVEERTYAVCPQVGYCVFFPSYFFHGTVPFHGDGIRMTAPCDISPA
ncbi:tetratricopeptide repeat protein [Pseudidiomarina andamanensis]|uniref:Tetratricopeptide repeat protein n=1 Tax=Pseudidiomarina andamanensis TaxID=1940690 RepID=A0AA92ERF8_9GAMM|nr:tetratricopeptide repeat protein [Pseudidiomarina andamanensis]MDS0217807.1 putative 2OG-Fe(II) oxygenase [Pseudidiomarina andamanensis]QGT94713.1 hypothetical protein D3795_00245 [Pseudidiomarina andamanensis]